MLGRLVIVGKIGYFLCVTCRSRRLVSVLGQCIENIGHQGGAKHVLCK